MKFIIDECSGPAVSKWMIELGYDIFSVSLEARGLTDLQILEKAVLENRIIITNDKDFGELIFKTKLDHRGVLFMRLADETSKNKIIVLSNFFKNHSQLIDNQSFIVITEQSIRVAKR